MMQKIDLVVNYFGGKPMKREEKNQQTQRRIMDSTLALARESLQKLSFI